MNKVKVVLGKAFGRFDAFKNSCIEQAKNEHLGRNGSEGRVTYQVSLVHPEHVFIGKGRPAI